MDNQNEEQFNISPEEQKKYKFFAYQHPVGVATADNPYVKDIDRGGREAFFNTLRQAQIAHQETDGKYELPERTALIDHPTREQMFELGHHFGQESVIYGENGQHELIYTNGPNAGRWVRGIPERYKLFPLDKPPKDYYTLIPDKGYARLDFDWNNFQEPKLTGAAAEKAAQIRAEHEQKAVNKSEQIKPAHNLLQVGQESEGSNSVADEKEYTIPEVRLALAKAMKERVQNYAEEMRQLRSRELQKSEEAPLVKTFEMQWAEYKAKALKKSATMDMGKNLSMGYGPQTTNPPAGGHLSLSEEKPKAKSEHLCKMCKKAHSEIEKCDTANVKSVKKNDEMEMKEKKMQKDVSSMVVHDSKASKPPKGADYKSKQEGSKAVYEAKKPGIFGKLADQKMEKYGKNESEMQKAENRLAGLSLGEASKHHRQRADYHSAQAGQSWKHGDKHAALAHEAAMANHRDAAIEAERQSAYNPKTAQWADNQAEASSQHADSRLKMLAGKGKEVQKKEDEPKSKDLKQVGVLPGDKPSKKVKIKDAGSGGEIKSVKKSDGLMGKMKNAAGKVKDALTSSNQKRADAMPNHGFNKEGKPAYLDKADAPMSSNHIDHMVQRNPSVAAEHFGHLLKPHHVDQIVQSDPRAAVKYLKDKLTPQHVESLVGKTHAGELPVFNQGKLGKADAPMAKPPSGKNMATATPVASNTSKPGLTKNAGIKLPGMKAPKLPKVTPTATAQVRANAPDPEQKPPSND